MDEDENTFRHRTNLQGESSSSSGSSNKQSDDEVIQQKENYFKALETWLHQAQIQQNISSYFPYYMMSMQSMSNGPYVNNNYQIPRNVPFNLAFQNNIVPNRNIMNGLHFGRNAQTQLSGGYIFVIPPLWKRFVAEFIDFVILFFLKLGVTLIAVDFFDYIDLDKYDIENIRKNLQEDYRLAFEMTTEILILECIYRILVCFFEAICLSVTMNGRVIGATPGKALLGLRVVNANEISPLPNINSEMAVVSPGSDLTFWTALARSVIKNVLIALLFPLCFILFIFQFNRTGYDIFCNVVVVEDNPYPPELQRQ